MGMKALGLGVRNLITQNVGSTFYSGGKGWWESAAYAANDNVDGALKMPGYIGDFQKGRYAKPALGVDTLVSQPWTLGVTGGTGTATELPAGQLNLTGDGTNPASARKVITTVAGKLYRIEQTVGASAVQLRLGTSDGGTQLAVATLAVGPNVVYFVATTTSTYVNFTKVVAALTTVSAITMKEVVGLQDGQFDDLFRFTRNGPATYVDAQGVLQTATTDVPRFDYTNGKRQLLLEGVSTNLIRNNTMVGASVASNTPPTNWGVSTLLNGVTRTVTEVGTLNGREYVKLRFAGVPSASGFFNIAFDVNSSIAYAPNDPVANSVFAAVTGGSLSGVSTLTLRVAQYSAAVAYLTDVSTITDLKATITSSPKRYEQLGTTSHASVAFGLPYIQFTYTIGVAVDIELMVMLPQLEKQTSCSSVIKTSGTAVTRAPDSCRYTEDHRAMLALTAASTLVQAEGVVGIIGVYAACMIGAASSRRLIGSNVAGNTVVLGDAAVIGKTIAFPIVPSGTIGAWNAAGKAFTVNGQVIVTDAIVLDTPITDFYLGRASSANFGNGWYDQLVTWPFRAANSNLPGKAIPYAA